MTELVVGDIVDVKQGDRVPADCVLVEEMNITVDQNYYFAGEFDVEKEQSEKYVKSQQTAESGPDNHSKNIDCFLLTDSKIMTGQGKAVVCAVGDNTLLARLRAGEDLFIPET